MQRSRMLRSTCSIIPPRCSGARVSSARAKAWAKCVLSTTPRSCSVSTITMLAAARPAIASSSESNSRVTGLNRAPEGREQHVHVDRLGDVVAGARLDALLAVAEHGFRGDRDDRHAAVAL